MAGSPVSDEERKSIIRAALYLAPRYHHKGKWQLKGRMKFAEVKRMLGNKRTTNSLVDIFTRWYSKNAQEWDAMREEAEKDWDAYFAYELQISMEGGCNKANKRNGVEGKAPTRTRKRRLSEEASAGINTHNTQPAEPIHPVAKRSHGEKTVDERAEGGGQSLQGATGNNPPPASQIGTALGEAPTSSSTGLQIYCYGPVNYYYGSVNLEKE